MEAITAAPAIPEFMKAVQAIDYGDIDEMLSVHEKIKVPRLSDLPPKMRSSHILIQTHAVALAPGDCRVLSGLTREMQGPPSFPYVPGGDCCGTVVEMPSDQNLPFQLGDTVAARFNEKPLGALGEYAIVSTNICDIVPEGITSEEAAVLASASPATIFGDTIQKGDRILVLGAGGGIGSHVCQLARHRGASLVVGVSRDPERLVKAPLSCHKAIDYTKEDVFSIQEYQDNPFDTILDLASGGWSNINDSVRQKVPLIVKTAANGGKFLTPTPTTATFEMHGVWDMLHFIIPPLYRAIASRIWRRFSVPKYSFIMGLPSTRDVITRTLELAKQGTVKAVSDPLGPFPFTTTGVRQAFRLQESRHMRGKVVIRVSEQKE
jgi:NADPH:quinone reductase-like Zn-dependent oxidoreductase